MVIEFRPDTLIQKYHELLDEFLQSFCDPKTGEFKPEHSEVIDRCPACGEP